MEGTDDVRAALRQAGVAVSWVFGSRAAGTARPASDFDLALLTPEGSPAPTLLELAELTRVLEGLLAVPVDLVDFRRAPLELRARVVLTGRLLHSDDEPLRVRTVVDTQSRWEDVRPALAAMDRAYLAAVADRGLLAPGPARPGDDEVVDPAGSEPSWSCSAATWTACATCPPKTHMPTSATTPTRAATSYWPARRRASTWPTT